MTTRSGSISYVGIQNYLWGNYWNHDQVISVIVNQIGTAKYYSYHRWYSTTCFARRSVTFTFSLTELLSNLLGNYRHETLEMGKRSCYVTVSIQNRNFSLIVLVTYKKDTWASNTNQTFRWVGSLCSHSFNLVASYAAKFFVHASSFLLLVQSGILQEHKIQNLFMRNLTRTCILKIYDYVIDIINSLLSSQWCC